MTATLKTDERIRQAQTDICAAFSATIAASLPGLCKKYDLGAHEVLAATAWAHAAIIVAAVVAVTGVRTVDAVDLSEQLEATINGWVERQKPDV